VDKVLQTIPVLFAAVMIAASTHTKPASIPREGVILTAPAAGDDAPVAMQVASDGEAPATVATTATEPPAASEDGPDVAGFFEQPAPAAPPVPVYPVATQARPSVVYYRQCGPTGCYSGGYQYRTRRALLPWRR
jgi:hypothetical protein